MSVPLFKLGLNSNIFKGETEGYMHVCASSVMYVARHWYVGLECRGGAGAARATGHGVVTRPISTLPLATGPCRGHGRQDGATSLHSLDHRHYLKWSRVAGSGLQMAKLKGSHPDLPMLHI